MKRQILFLSMVLFAVWSVFSQTPYDNFAPEQSIKSMIEMPEMQFKVVNSISTNEVHSMEFDKKTLSLYLLNDNDSILKTVVLNLNDKKFISIDPLAEKYYSISPYAYCLNNPVRFVDPGGDSVRVYTETQGAGHAWVSVGEGDDMVVYSYGRYSGTYKGAEGSSNTFANGPGVLLRLTGEDAKAYNEEKTSKGMSVYVNTDVMDEDVASILNERFNSSTTTPTQGKYKGNPSAHVIDEYNLMGNNCTTVVVDALAKAGTNLFNITKQITNRSIGESFQIQMKERPVVPVFFRNYLKSRSLVNGPVYKIK